MSSVESAETGAPDEASDRSAAPSETECCGGIGDPRMDCDSPLSAHLRGNAEGREGCPTPLAWQQVLGSVSEQSTPWSISFAHGHISGIEFGQGEPIYFLNPSAGDHKLWMLFCWIFREERTCVLFDEPAWQRWPAPANWLSRMAEAVRAIAEHRGDNHFSVYASGIGGLVALQLMRSFPGLVDRAVLQGAFLRRRWSVAERLLARIGRFTSGPVARLPGWSKIQEQNHRLCFPPYDPTRWTFLHDNLGVTPIRQAALKMAVAAKGLSREALAGVKSPIMLLRCEADGAALMRAEEELAAALPDAQIEWMHTSGHFPHVTHPHRLAKLVRPFLAQAMATASK